MKLNTCINNLDVERNITGADRKNLVILEELYNCDIEIYNGSITTNSKDEEVIKKLERIFSLLAEASELGAKFGGRDIVYLANLVESNEDAKYLRLFENKKAISYTYSNKPIYPKTLKQIDYVKAMQAKDIVFSLGAAGTGKTFLAVAYAVWELKKGNYQRIILTRPAVEAGESLGFLPGDLKEKIDPYLRPLYDALYDTLGYETTEALISKQVIEIAPLAYMRGRTLENAFVILDEAQNATKEQLKMFLTRLGFHSKMIVTGDPSQIDLSSKQSGLLRAARLLDRIPEIGVVEFEAIDVVRHPLVGKIIEVFEENKL